MIGRGRRREHTQPTLFTTTTGVAQLPVAYTQSEPRRGQMPFGSHVTTTKKKALGEMGMRRAYFRSGPLPGSVTSGQKPPLGRYCAISGCSCAEHDSGLDM